MVARRFALNHFASSTIALLLVLMNAHTLLAQDTPQPDVENAKFQITGLINANAVFVRSGPSENDYATAKVDKGAQVTVVGERFNWLKIVPPEGSFCYVGKAWVNRAGNGSIGQVINPLNVRIGSDLNQLKTKIGTKLEPGQKVEIIGEQDEYFKIKPPAGVYLYVSKQFVDPVAQAQANPPGNSNNDSNVLNTSTPRSVAEAGSINTGGPATAPSDATVPGNQTAEGPTSQPVASALDQQQPNDVAPSTQPAATSAEAVFEQLQAQYAEVSKKPLEEQPAEELLDGYKKLAASNDLPESLRRICDFKAGVLSNRVELKKELAGHKQIVESLKEKQAALKGEQKDLEELVKKTKVDIYTGVGTLRTSSLQQGQQTLYRLTDPANGRTVVYVRNSEDNKLGQLIGQFIGVRGEVTTDPQLGLKIITPTASEPVDPAKIGQNVAAQFVPASLLPASTGTASTGDAEIAPK
ncbi:MAG TPA: SH3 domain-containing protein [Tepidisphaeraceae bacterium]|jgi:uncharacterized protein YgiM (DUF1202 family)